jgi:DnaJ-class molecular chaperone
MKIPAGSDSGKKFRLQGKGIGSDRYVSGDQIVEIQIVSPEYLNSTQMDLLKKFEESLTDSNNSKVKTFRKTN